MQTSEEEYTGFTLGDLIQRASMGIGAYIGGLLIAVGALVAVVGGCSLLIWMMFG